MIDAAEREGLIEPGRTTIVEATSGNTGIALAFVCAAKGYDLVHTLPQGMSREREGLLRLYGARVQITESMGGMTEAVQAARDMATHDDVFLPDQFSNPANPEIHRRTTGPELWDVLDGRIDVFVAGVGTGGTITGVGEALKARNPRCRVIAVEPRSSAVLSGGRPGPHKIQGIGAGFVPAVLNRELLDEVIAVEDEDAIETPRGRARRDVVRRGGVGGTAGRGPARVPRAADRHDPARLGGALRVDPVLRALSGPERRQLDQLADRVAERHRALLNPGGVRGRDAHADGRQGQAAPAARAGEGDRGQAHAGRRLQGTDDVGRRARRRQRDDDIAGASERLHLAGEHLIVGEVVGDRRRARPRRAAIDRRAASP